LSYVKSWKSVLVACAIAAAVVSGCSKSSDQNNPSAEASGPVTDEANTGLKPAEVAAGPAMGDANHGQAIFVQNCSACHGVGGKGGGIGPSLIGEKSRKDYAAAIVWIKNPMAPMPKLYPSPLKEGDVADVAAYVESL
jgi:mono/diheme cytochrome c family protein